MQTDRPDRNVSISVSLGAIRHNLQRCKTRVGPNVKIFAVVKSDAYGHGVTGVLPALAAADALAVVNVAEALALRRANSQVDILVLQGPQDAAQLAACISANIAVVIHHESQLVWFDHNRPQAIKCWIKIDTGMGRLGFAVEQLTKVRQLLNDHRVQLQGVLSHLACADLPDSPLTSKQLQNFTSAMPLWGVDCVFSMANSAALLERTDSHFDWVRPGLMLYGASPFADRLGSDHGLRPAMTVEAPIIALREHRAGQHIGYGCGYTCERAVVVAVIGAGYGDGYPRAAPNGTPVDIAGYRCGLVGRVSMDSIIVDISHLPVRPQVGDKARLWGTERVAVEDVAAAAGMIPYELLCTIRGERVWE